jgi:hypothetical protein
MKPGLFWDFTQCRVVVCWWCLGTTYWFRLQGWVSPRRTAGPMKMGPSGCPKTLVKTTIPRCVLSQNRADLKIACCQRNIRVACEMLSAGDKAFNTYNFFSFLRPFKFSIFLILLFWRYKWVSWWACSKLSVFIKQLFCKYRTVKFLHCEIST